MNLVQIQERLKDMPTQAIMSYANGMNPEVPPYLALGELNRRKQMEQKSAQAPTGTVKDNIEQQMSTMQMQAAKQRQMAQQMAQQGAQAQMPVPPGVPEPQMQAMPEDSGVATLPTGEMNFGSGGIVAFANKEGKQLVEDEDRAMMDLQTEIEYRERAERQRRLEADRAKSMAEVANQSFTNPGMQNDPRLVGKTPPAETLGTLPPLLRNVPPGGIVNVPPKIMQQNATPATPAAPPAPPAAPVMSDAQKFQQGILSGKNLETLPPEFVAPKQAPIGEEYTKYMTDREQKRREDALKREDIEAARSKRDLFNALIAGGEATRGQKGIGALFAGTGRALGESATAAEERAMAYQEKQQQLADNDAKTQFEIINLRRAEERGDAKAVYDSKMKLYDLKQEQLKIKGQTASDMVKREAEEKSDLRKIAADKELAALKYDYDKKLKGIPQAQRATLEEQYVQAAVKAGKTLQDAIREVKTLGVDSKSQLTYSQAADDVDNFLKSTQGMTYIAGLNKTAKEKKEPMLDPFTIRKNLIEQQMQQSGSKNAPKSDLLKAADAIVGGK